jgi:putative polyhydroxyalkanoate system protein
MARITISCDHKLDPAEARAVADRLAVDLHKRYQLACRWKGTDLHFERSGLSGCMHVTGNHIDLEVTLGFLLSPMKSTIEREIRAELDRALAVQAKDISGNTRTD